MSHPQLVILGYSEATMFARSAPKGAIVGIVSIHGRHEPGVVADVPYRIDLSFDDTDATAVDATPEGLASHARQKWNSRNNRPQIPPTRSAVFSLIEFARKVKDEDGVILCHCGAGVSRAPAAALICLATWRGEGSEVECYRELLQVRSCARPNHWLVKTADELLDRNGKLVAALSLCR